MTQKFHIWLVASRPKTLTASISPIILGLSFAYYSGFFNSLTAIITILAAILIQIGTNLANDVFDFEKGADFQGRLGPTRVTQAGLLTVEQVKKGMIFSFSIALFFGFYLSWIGGLPIVIIGSTAILAGIAYTGGPFPLGYNGLGDIFVFVFFGLIAVAGTFYLQGGPLFDSTSLILGVCIGLIADCILIINNLRDIETDRKSGKNTLAVRMGKKFSILQYNLFLILPFAIPFYLYYFVETKFSWFLCFFLLPLALNLAILSWTKTDEELNNLLEQTARLQFLYALMLSLGFIV